MNFMTQVNRHVSPSARWAFLAAGLVCLGLGCPVSTVWAAAITWNGSSSTEWSLAGNWSSNSIPGSADDVTIPANVASGRYPVVSTAAANAMTVTLAAGAGTAPTLTVSANTLTVAGNFTVNNGTVTHSGGTIAVTAGVISITGTLNESGGTFLSAVTLTVNSGGNVNVSGSGIIHMASAIGTTPTDNLVISAGGTITQSGGTVDNRDLTTTAGSPNGTYNQSGGTYKHYHDFKNSGTFNATGGTVEFATVGGGGTWPSTTGPTQFFNVLMDVDPVYDNNTVSFSVAGNWTSNAAVNMSGKAVTVTFNGTGAQTIGGSATTTFRDVTVNKSAGTATLTASQTITNGNLTVTAGTLDLSSFTLNRSSSGGILTVSNGATLKLGGTTTFPSSYATVTLGATSTVEYSGTNQTVTNQAYGHLTLSGSGTKTLPGTALAILGNLTMSGTCTATAASALTVSGDVTIGNGCTLGAASFAHSFGGNMSNSGTFTGSTSRVTFTGSATHTVSGNGTTSFNNITINKGNSYATVLDVQAVITMASGGLTLVNGTFKVSSASTITPFTADITTSPYLIPSTAGLWVNGGAVSTTADVTTAGMVHVSSGTFNVGNAVDQAFRSSWCTVIIDGGTFNVAGRFTRRVAGEGTYFTMSSGTLNCATVGNTAGTTGPFTIDVTTSTFTMSGGTIVIRRPGITTADYWNLAATTNVTGGTLQMGDASTPASQTLRIDSTAPIWNLTVNSTNSPVAQLVTDALVVKNDLTISGGTLNANNLNLNVAGIWTNNSSTSAFTAGTATVTFDGAGAQTIGGSFSTTLNNATVNKSGGTATLSSNESISSNLSVSAGTLDLDVYTANRTSSGGTITVSNGATLKIGGTNGFPSNYTTATLGATSTVEYSGTTQSVAAKSYGHLTISGSSAKTLAAATAPAGNLTVSAGTFDLSTFTCDRSGAGGTITVSNGATLSIGGTNGFPANYTAKTLGATSTVNYSGTTQPVAVQNYGHLTISGSTTKTLAGTTTPAGDLTVSAGTFDLSAYTCNRSSSGGTLTVSNGATLKIGSTNGFPASYTTNTLGATSTVEYGGTAQSVGALTYGHLTISGGSTKTLAGDASVAGTLTLTSGNITTGSNTLFITSTGSVSRTSGHIVGNLKKNVATGATSRTFEVGDATNYTPAAVVFGSVTVAGDLTATTAASDHANIATSTIAPSRTVNRTWSLTNSGVAFTNYSATFTFVSGDIDAGASTSSFVVGKYSGGSWTYPTVGSKTATSTQITGVTSFSDFTIGEAANYSVSATTGSFAFGTQLLNTWLTAQSSLLTNDGNVTANLVGQITTLTDGSHIWSTNGSGNGADIARAQYSTTGSSGPWTDITVYDSDFTIANSIAINGTATVWLRVQTPTSTGSYLQHAATLKVYAR